MSKMKFYDLPFNERPDLTPYVIHLTKSSEARNGFSNLKKILSDGKIMASDSSGFIKGPNKATCFMDIPFTSLKYVVTRSEKGDVYDRYEPYGIFIRKSFLYKRGGRPVLYLSNDEVKSIGIEKKDHWRVVNFYCDENNKWISWLHEREWRIKNDFQLPKTSYSLGVIVRTPREVTKIKDFIKKNESKLKCKPEVILPLDVICQGLIY